MEKNNEEKKPEKNNRKKNHELVLKGDKDVLNEELIKAIPEFLNQGLLITNVQEAVHE